MKALLITYHFPPMLGCCSLRTGAVARALASKGCECHILTGAIRSNHPVYTVDLQTQPSEALWHLYPISEGLIGRFIHRVRQRKSRPESSLPVTAERRALQQPSWTTNLLRATAFPDSKVNWIPGALRIVRRLLKRHKFDLIYSFGYPWSCHAVAYVAQGRTGAAWVADYADPWTGNPDTYAFPSWRKRLDFMLESRILRRAAAVVVATPESQALMTELFGPEVAKRSHVARVAQFSCEDYALPGGNLPEHFQIAFTGLFNVMRQPYSFYDALQAIAGDCDVRVCLAGLIDEQFKNYSRNLGLEHKIHYLGRLGRRRTIELQQTSHVLLSFGWPGGLQTPCKVYEYFAARRPLLHIEGDARDPAAALVRRYRRGLVVPNDVQAISEGLRTLHDLWTAGKLEECFDLSPLDEFHLPRSLDGIEQAFDDVLRRKPYGGAVHVSESVAAQVQSHR